MNVGDLLFHIYSRAEYIGTVARDAAFDPENNTEAGHEVEAKLREILQQLDNIAEAVGEYNQELEVLD